MGEKGEKGRMNRINHLHLLQEQMFPLEFYESDRD
jgi:hypothetical protein